MIRDTHNVWDSTQETICLFNSRAGQRHTPREECRRPE